MNGEVIMNRWVALATLTFLLATGAARAWEAGRPDTTSQGRTAEITLTPDNQFKVGDDTVSLAKLPDKLKKAGADRSTQILISIDRATSQDTLKNIIGKLRSSGFTRIMFTKPRHADAHVGSDPQAPSTARKEAAGKGR